MSDKKPTISSILEDISKLTKEQIENLGEVWDKQVEEVKNNETVQKVTKVVKDYVSDFESEEPKSDVELNEAKKCLFYLLLLCNRNLNPVYYPSGHEYSARFAKHHHHFKCVFMTRGKNTTVDYISKVGVKLDQLVEKVAGMGLSSSKIETFLSKEEQDEMNKTISNESYLHPEVLGNKLVESMNFLTEHPDFFYTIEKETRETVFLAEFIMYFSHTPDFINQVEFFSKED